jgi:hypothetical protein
MYIHWGTQMRAVISAWLIALSISASAQPAVVTETVETIPSREGHTQTFLLAKVPNPVATLILYSGNKGHIGIFPNGSAQFDQFFVYRARRLLAEHGFNVLMLDAPSEWGTRGVWEKQRTPEFTAHNTSVIRYARELAPVPVVLVGSSSGGITATAVATQLKDKGADGLVLVSPWMPPKDKWPIPSFVYSSDFSISSWPDLAHIRGPMLLIHHIEDNCGFSLPEFVPQMVSALSAARKPDVVGLKGGVQSSGNPCYPNGLNNFNGMEREVSDVIASWVKQTIIE